MRIPIPVELAVETSEEAKKWMGAYISRTGFSITPMRSPSARLPMPSTWLPYFCASEFAKDFDCKLKEIKYTVENCEDEIDMLRVQVTKLQILVERYAEIEHTDTSEVDPGKLLHETTKSAKKDMQKIKKAIALCKQGIDELVIEVNNLSISSGLNQPAEQPGSVAQGQAVAGNQSVDQKDSDLDSSNSEPKSIEYEWF